MQINVREREREREREPKERGGGGGVCSDFTPKPYSWLALSYLKSMLFRCSVRAKCPYRGTHKHILGVNILSWKRRQKDLRNDFLWHDIRFLPILWTILVRVHHVIFFWERLQNFVTNTKYDVWIVSPLQTNDCLGGDKLNKNWSLIFSLHATAEINLYNTTIK